MRFSQIHCHKERGLLRFEQKCLTGGKLIAFRASSKPSNAEREDSVSRRLRSGLNEENERKEMEGNNQNEIMCRTTSCASTSVASVSDVVN